jgi:hypothetical protein
VKPGFDIKTYKDAEDRFTRVVNLSETSFTPDAQPTLRVEGVISRLGGGSQAARAFAGRPSPS